MLLRSFAHLINNVLFRTNRNIENFKILEWFVQLRGLEFTRSGLIIGLIDHSIMGNVALFASPSKNTSLLTGITPFFHKITFLNSCFHVDECLLNVITIHPNCQHDAQKHFTVDVSGCWNFAKQEDYQYFVISRVGLGGRILSFLI